MNATTQLSASLQDAFDHPTRGVVGLVDDLLALCPEEGLQLHWEADRCRIRSVANGSGELVSFPLRKSVFRSVLARVATLCNERSANSVSPYGGQGELVLDGEGDAALRVTITNTTDEQSLKLVPAPK